jgi:DNA-binding MarR family transcriptional regulator
MQRAPSNIKSSTKKFDEAIVTLLSDGTPRRPSSVAKDLILTFPGIGPTKTNDKFHATIRHCLLRLVGEKRVSCCSADSGCFTSVELAPEVKLEDQPAWLRILRTLEIPAPASAVEFARAMNITRAGSSAAIKDLVAAGLIKAHHGAEVGARTLYVRVGTENLPSPRLGKFLSALASRKIHRIEDVAETGGLSVLVARKISDIAASQGLVGEVRRGTVSKAVYLTKKGEEHIARTPSGPFAKAVTADEIVNSYRILPVMAALRALGDINPRSLGDALMPEGGDERHNLLIGQVLQRLESSGLIDRTGARGLGRNFTARLSEAGEIYVDALTKPGDYPTAEELKARMSKAHERRKRRSASRAKAA